MKYSHLIPFLLAGMFAMAGCVQDAPESEPPVPPPTTSGKTANAGGAETKTQAQPQPKPESKAATPKATPPSSASGNTLAHGGVVFTVPEGWEKQAVESGGLSARAAYKLPVVEGDTVGSSMRLTHYPNMRGPQFDEMNIKRWVGQVKKPDGSAMTVGDAKVEKIDLGNGVFLTIVDLEGQLAGGMGVTASSATRRMISAIVNHPNGPHFVKTTGSTKSMEKSVDSIMAFLKSAKVAG
ncbi:MAG: hypothetical protein ACYTHJ_02685 [Planctomycetota bacterium]|jgi:hypothetical protein